MMMDRMYLKVAVVLAGLIEILLLALVFFVIGHFVVKHW